MYVIGIIGVAASFVLMFLGMPIGFALALVGGVGVIFLASISAGLSSIPSLSWTWGTNYTFSCIPMFVLMGLIVARSGIAKQLFSVAYKWFGRVPGGLGIATIIACGFFGAVSGAASAAAVTMGAICYPEMKRYNYDPAFAAGTIAIGATLDTMIPPSVAMVFYGMLTDASVGKMFIAGFVPGFLEVIFFCLAIQLMTRRNPSLAPVSPVAYPMRDKLRSLTGLAPTLVIFLLTFGGLYAGVFTPTEAGAAGAFSAIIVTLAMRQLSWKGALAALSDSLRTAGMVFMMLMGAMIFNRFITMSGLATALSQWVTSMKLSPLAFVSLVMLLYLPLGALMDEAAMIMLTIPVYLPTLNALGIDLIWFGILSILSVQIGMVAPPVGLITFVTQGTIKEVSVAAVYKGVLPFILVAIVVMAILIAVPELSLVLVKTMK